MKKYLRILSILMISFILICLTKPVEAKAAHGECKTVRVGYYENEAFEEGASEGAIKKGYAYEYYRRISEYTGWKYEYVYGDFVDIYQMLLDGEVDLVAGLAYTDERAQILNYPDQPMGYEQYGLVKHENDTTINGNSSTLNGKRIGVLESVIEDTLRDFLEQENVTAKVITYHDYESLLADFDKKNIDVLAAENDGIYDRNHAEVIYNIGSAEYYIGVAPDRADLLKDLNQAQQQLFMEEPDFISILRTKYYPVTLSSRAYTISEREWLKDHDTLKVGYLNDYLPYSDTDDEGNPTGLVKDVFPYIFEKLGIKDTAIEYTSYDSYDDIIAAIASNEIDVAFPVGGGLFYSEEDGMYLSNEVISAQSDLIYSEKYFGTTISDFAVNENNKLQSYYVKMYFPDASISYYPSIEACLDAVDKGEVTCTVVNGLRTNIVLKSYKYQDLSFRQIGHQDAACFGVKIGNDGLLKLLNRGLNVIGTDYAQNVAYEYAKVLESDTIFDFLRENVWYISIVFGALFIIILILLARDVLKSRKIASQTEALAKELAKASYNKTVFLNNMAHDIRKPVNSINGLIDLSKHSNDKAERDNYLDEMSMYSDRLLSTINNVLDFSRIESGEVKLLETNSNLRELINELRAAISGTSADKNQIVNFDVHNVTHANVICDKLRVFQLFLNLLNSACTYATEGSLIEVSVDETSFVKNDVATYEFRIKSNTSDISIEGLKRILDPYHVSQQGKDVANESTDFTLALVKKLIDMMNGKVEFFNLEGTGNEVVVTLPLRVSEDVVLEDVSVSKTIDDYNFYGKRVLVVEDTLPNQMVAAKILNKVGIEVQVANDGEEAYEKINAAPSGYFDAIVMNQAMFDADDHEAITNIRGLSDNSKAGIPIMPITTNILDMIQALSEEFEK